MKGRGNPAFHVPQTSACKHQRMDEDPFASIHRMRRDKAERDSTSWRYAAAIFFLIVVPLAALMYLIAVALGTLTLL